MDVLFWVELQTLHPRLTGFVPFWHWCKWKSSKMRKTLVLIASHSLKTHTDTELCQWEKATTLGNSWRDWETHGNSLLWAVPLQEQPSMDFFYCFVLFFKACVKEHLLPMEDLCIRSINHSSRAWGLLLLLEDLNNLISTPIFSIPAKTSISSKRQKIMFSCYRNLVNNACSLGIMSGVIFLIGLENTGPPWNEF